MKTAKLYKFPDRDSPDNLPKLVELCSVLKKNHAVLDEVDRSFFALIHRVMMAGNKAKIETVLECQAIAWSMCKRYGLGPGGYK